jgi:hypothetical protein
MQTFLRKGHLDSEWLKQMRTVNRENQEIDSRFRDNEYRVVPKATKMVIQGQQESMISELRWETLSVQNQFFDQRRPQNRKEPSVIQRGLLETKYMYARKLTSVVSFATRAEEDEPSE